MLHFCPLSAPTAAVVSAFRQKRALHSSAVVGVVVVMREHPSLGPVQAAACKELQALLRAPPAAVGGGGGAAAPALVAAAAARAAFAARAGAVRAVAAAMARFSADVALHQSGVGCLLELAAHTPRPEELLAASAAGVLPAVIAALRSFSRGGAAAAAAEEEEEGSSLVVLGACCAIVSSILNHTAPPPARAAALAAAAAASPPPYGALCRALLPAVEHATPRLRRCGSEALVNVLFFMSRGAGGGQEKRQIV